MEDLKTMVKTKLNSVYGVCASGAITPTLTDDEIIQKVRKQVRLLLYGYFSADRLSMEDFEQFSYAIECMDNEFYGRYGLC